MEQGGAGAGELARSVDAMDPVDLRDLGDRMLRVKMQREDKAIVPGELRPGAGHRAIDLIAIRVAQEVELGTTRIEGGGAELVEHHATLGVACVLQGVAHADHAHECTERAAAGEGEDRGGAGEQADPPTLGSLGGRIGWVAAAAEMCVRGDEQGLELRDRAPAAQARGPGGHDLCRGDDRIGRHPRRELVGRGKDVGVQRADALDHDEKSAHDSARR